MRKWHRFATRFAVRLLLGAILCLVVADRASAQTRTGADGPWAGWVQCQITAQFSGAEQTYLNQQTHTWVLTGTSPVSGTDIKIYPATWTVTGQGSRQRPATAKPAKT